MDFDKHGKDIVCDKVGEKEGGDCYTKDLHQETHSALAKGGGRLEGMNEVFVKHHESLLNGIKTEGKVTKVGLFKWVKDLYTFASAEALFGSENPISWDRGMIPHLWYVGTVVLLIK